MIFDFNDYRNKVYGCFVGKCVGGTLGMKYEGKLDYNYVTYYNPVPTEMIPNDDLDLQVVNLETVLRSGLPVSRYYLGEIWKYHISDFSPDEYAVGVSNYKLKMYAPLSGIYRNKFYAGMGAAIRSELWACLAPANPALAAKFAREDACTDHYADGIYAEMFLAAVESAAFVEKDLIKLIDIGMQYIADGSKLKNAFCDVIKWYNESVDILDVRAKVLENYYSENWTDVIINLSFILLSLLSCENSFDKAICTATSLGYDADCTAATVGSIFGIMDPNGIDEKWTAPIGDKVLLSNGVINMHEPLSIDDFCDNVIFLAGQVEKFYSTGVTLAVPADFKDVKIGAPWQKSWEEMYNWQENLKESLILVKPFSVTLAYPETVGCFPEKENNFTLKITNTTDAKLQGEISLSMPAGFDISLKNAEISLNVGESANIPFIVKITALKRRVPLNLLTINLHVNGMIIEAEAGLPVSAPWAVENLKNGEKSTAEACGSFFDIPAGAYKYSATFISSAERSLRITASGKRTFTVYLNGEEVFKREYRGYVPAYHREYDWFRVHALRGANLVEVVFNDEPEGEFFFCFAEDTRLPNMVDSMERM